MGELESQAVNQLSGLRSFDIATIPCMNFRWVSANDARGTLTNRSRPLVSTLRAAEKFEQSRFSLTVVSLIDAAKVLYASESWDPARSLWRRERWGELPRYPQDVTFVDDFPSFSSSTSLLPSLVPSSPASIILLVSASASGLPDPKRLPAITKALAQQPGSKPTHDRIVVFTHGTTTAACPSSPDNVRTYAVNAPGSEEIVDTNGTGVCALTVGRSFDEIIGVGHALSTVCITQVVPQYEWTKVKVL